MTIASFGSRLRAVVEWHFEKATVFAARREPEWQAEAVRHARIVEQLERKLREMGEPTWPSAR